MKKILFVAVAVFLLSGCALGPRRPMLGYSIVLQPAVKNNIVIAVSEFKDERTWSKEKIGDVKNGYGMRMGDIIPQNSVTAWVTDALKKELDNAGYIISNEVTTSNSIEGVVLEVYTDSYMNYGGRVKVKVTLRKGEEVLFNNEYSAQKNAGMAWGYTAASYGKTMEWTLQEVMKKIIPDINQALRQ